MLVTVTVWLAVVVFRTALKTSSAGLVLSLPAPLVMAGLTFRTMITASWKSTGVSTSSGATM